MYKRKATLLLIDPHIIFIEGIQSLLKERTEYEVLGLFTDPKEGLAALKRLKPDISILGCGLEKINTISLVREIKLINKKAKIMILSGKIREFLLFQLIDMGVNGYISRTNEFSIVNKAINEIMKDQTFYDHIAAGFLANRSKNGENDSSIQTIYKKLTCREKEIMTFLLEGVSTKEIADILHICRKTVTTHKSNIYKKFRF